MSTVSTVSTATGSSTSTQSGSDPNLKRADGLPRTFSDCDGFDPVLAMQVGAFTEKGFKPGFPIWENQDRHLVLPLGAGRLLVGIFDGHGMDGHTVAEQVCSFFARTAPRLIPQAPAPLNSYGASAALQRLFAMAHTLLEQQAALAEFSGTTATVAVLDTHSRKMMVAHAGDSSLGVFASGAAIHATKDHVVDEESAQRVRACGGEVRASRCGGISAPRIFAPGRNVPGLMMSRSLGDLCAHRLGALAVPEVEVDLPMIAGSTIVVASDGVWEKMPVNTVAASLPVLLTAARGCSGSVAHALVARAGAVWSSSSPGYKDDITAIVVTIGDAEASAMNGQRP